MKITFLGGGNMANALIGGLIEKGFTPSSIAVIELNEDTRQKLSETYGVQTAHALSAATVAVDLIVLAVKPQQMKEACQPLCQHLKETGHFPLIVSIAAGLRLTDLSRWLNGHRKLVRTMPNTPALIGAGMTGMNALPEVSGEERRMAERVMQAVGHTLWIDDEEKMDAVTALSGSGPAYVFLFIEALQQAGMELGLSAEQSRQLALETTLGAAKLAAHSTEPVSLLRERVTSKGGTTAAALASMAERGVAAGIIAGVKSAEARGRELGTELGAASGTP